MAKFNANEVQIFFGEIDLSADFDPDQAIEITESSLSVDLPDTPHYQGITDVSCEITLTYEVEPIEMMKLSWMIFGYNPILAFRAALIERLTLN